MQVKMLQLKLIGLPGRQKSMYTSMESLGLQDANKISFVDAL